MLIAGAAAPSMAQEGFSEDLGIVRACADDVWSLCSDVLPDVGRIKSCVQDKMGQLSKGCLDKLLDKMAGGQFKVCKDQTYALCAAARVLALKRYETISIAVAAAIEAGTGLVLIGFPSLFVRLLLGVELSEPGQVVGRLPDSPSSLWCWRAGPAQSRKAKRPSRFERCSSSVCSSRSISSISG